MNYLSAVKLVSALRCVRRNSGNPDFPMNALLVYAYIAARHPNEVPMGEVEDQLDLTQTTVSRSIGYLSTGAAKTPVGYRWIEVTVDPYYAKRKLCKLTPKGLKIATELSDIVEGKKQ